MNKHIPAASPVTLSIQLWHKGALNPSHYTVRVKSLLKAHTQVARIKRLYPFHHIGVSKTEVSK